MRKLTGLFVLCFLLSANALQAAEPEKVTSLIDIVENSDFFMKDTIVSKLVRLIQDFT